MSQAFMLAFADELIKVAASRPGWLVNSDYDKDDGDQITADALVESSIQPKAKNYVRSMLVGAALAPAGSLLTKHIGRVLHNRAIMKSLAKLEPSSVAAQNLLGELSLGKLVGPVIGGSSTLKPLNTKASLMTDAVGGGVIGSGLQALRDKLTLSESKEPNR